MLTERDAQAIRRRISLRPGPPVSCGDCGTVLIPDADWDRDDFTEERWAFMGYPVNLRCPRCDVDLIVLPELRQP